MKKILFDLKKEYYFNSLYPLYRELAADPRYDVYFNAGKDHKRFMGVFLLSRQKKIEASLARRGVQTTRDVSGFDCVVCGDAFKNPAKYGDTVRIHLDHGVGIKTLRIRNLKRQPDYRYHVFLEGQYWYDYIKSLGWEGCADFHITGIPKLDPFFWEGHYDNDALKRRMGLAPEKKTVLFAPSYRPSCITYIRERVLDLIPEYNLVVKLHPYSWSGKYASHSQHRLYEKLARNNRELFLIPQDDYDIYPYLNLSDTVISDTSSVINEFLALGRHGVIYELPHENLTHSDGMPILSIDPEEWLAGAFPHMTAPGQLEEAVDAAVNPTDAMRKKLVEYRDYFFTGLDGRSGMRVKLEMDRLLGLDRAASGGTDGV